MEQKDCFSKKYFGDKGVRRLKKIRISISKRDNLIGLFFVTPFLIGTAVFFIYPVVASLLLSFGDTDPVRSGFHIQLKGFENFYKAIFIDSNYIPRLLDIIKKTILNIPLIVIFSLILAIMLNKLTRFKGVFRVILLLPFLLGTGEVLDQLLGQGIDSQIISIANGRIIPRELIEYMGESVVKTLDSLFGIIVTVLWFSGVQTLLFLSALQSISPSLYESARVDGANEYEMFWKITLPMVAPILLLNSIYTIINSFTGNDNAVLEYIRQQIIRFSEHGYAAALGWIYFLFVLAIIGVTSLIAGRYARLGVERRAGKTA